MRKRHLLAVGLAASFATTCAGGLAWSAVTDDSAAIQGCYQKNEGQLRVVSSTDACRPSERPIAWSQEGAPGAQGDPGAPGRDGRDGLDGTSVSILPEPAGLNCPTGRVKLVTGNGVAYACNGAPPDPGLDG